MPELNKVLNVGEKVLWKGGPEKYKILDKTNTQTFILRCALCALICILVEISYILMARYSEVDILWWLIGLIFIGCVTSPILFLLRSRKLRKHVYVVTNTRLLILKDPVMMVSYRRIQECALKTDADGHTTLLCGNKAVTSKPRKWREISYFGDVGGAETDPCSTFAFYAVQRPDELRIALAGKVQIKN